MNQHLPPENVRSFGQFKAVDPTIAVPAFNEQFFILRGKKEPFIDLVNGTSRDATDDITGVVIQRWAEDGKLLTHKQREFVAMCKGEAFANCFRVEAA